MKVLPTIDLSVAISPSPICFAFSPIVTYYRVNWNCYFMLNTGELCIRQGPLEKSCSQIQFITDLFM